VPAFRRQVPRAEAAASYFVLTSFQQLVENMKKNGSAMHNATVTKKFCREPRTKDAVQQAPDDSLLTPIVTEAEAIVRINALRPYLMAHFADGKYAHLVADAASAAMVTAPDATDSASLTTLLVQLRLALNNHYQAVDSHNRMFQQISIATVPSDAATNIQVTNTILLLHATHLYSAAESFDVDPI